MLGFINRNTHDFKNIHALIMLYTSLIHSTLEYASFICDPHQQTIIERLNHIQNKFLSFSEHRCGIKLNLKPLTYRRRFNNIAFIFKLLNGSIDSPNILIVTSHRYSII